MVKMEIKKSVDIVKTNQEPYEILKVFVYHFEVLYIYGPPSSGKTYLATRVLHDNDDILYAYVDCNLLSTPSSLYLKILQPLMKTLRMFQGKLKSLPKLMGLTDFLKFYQIVVETAFKMDFKFIYVVLDRLELLRKTSLLDCIVALDRVRHLNLMMISCQDYRDILSSIKTVAGKQKLYDSIFSVQLSHWSRGDIVDAICDDEPKIEPELYRKFVNNVLTIVYGSYTKDFLEIKSFCQENYPKFHQFYVDKFKEFIKEKENITHEIKDEDLDNFELAEKKSMSIIQSFLGMFKNIIKQKDMRSWDQEVTDRQVVIGTSILILAAYVAAYTKPSDDKRNFVKFQKRKIPRHLKSEESVAAARPFTLERWLHIYKGISVSIQGESDDECAQNGKSSRERLPDSVLGDVQRLEDLNMIEVVAGDVFSSGTRYKLSSNVRRDYVDRIASQINFCLDHIYGLI